MDFFDVIRSRRSIRRYKPTPVPAEAIARINEAVTLAPTAVGFQPFKVYFITEKALLAKAAAVYKNSWLATAPAIAVVTGCKGQAWNRIEGDSIVDVDCAIVMEHITLAAAAEGLGSCWICAFERNAMDKVLNLPAGWHTFAITPVGYADADPVPLKRKNADETFQVI